MAKEIQQIDFCKGRLTKIAKSFDLAAPVDTAPLLGLASLGCRPLVSHRQDAGSEILSRFKQDKGTITEQILTTPNDSGVTGTFPNFEECFPYGALIAGLVGSNPIIGSATNPFPTTEPNRTLLWTVGNAGFTSVVNGTPQSLTGDPTAFDRGSSAEAQVGFGGTNGGASGGNMLVQLPPDNREYTGGVRLRANHHYVPFIELPYSPLLQPLLFQYSSAFGYSIIPGFFTGGQAVIGTNGTCDVEGYGAPVAPCLVSANGDFAPAQSNELNGPSLSRQYNLYRLAPFTLPGFGGSFNQTFDVPQSKIRAYLCVYVDSSRIDSVVCHEGANAGTTAVSLPTPGNGPPSAFTPVFPGIAFDTVYQFAVVGNEATYTFDVTHGATTITTTASAFFTLGGTHIRAFEVYLDMHKTGNPSLVC